MLVKNQSIKTSVNNNTLQWYIEKGYDCKCGDKIKIKAEELYEGSNQNVKVTCDYCGIVKDKKYKNYLDEIKGVVKKSSCCKCSNKKNLEEAIILNDKGELTIENKFFYSLHENRLNGLKEYLSKYGDVNSLFEKEEGKRLMGAISRHEEYIEDLLEELGYDYEQISNLRQTISPNYYKLNGLEKVIKRIRWFINKHNRFPTKKECENILKIGKRIINKYGGMNELRSKMNYTDVNDLVDIRGDYNKSTFELIVANFLCLQGFQNKYLREQHPFPKDEGAFRSDFTFYTENDNDKIIHAEVWGYDEKDNYICTQYNEQKSKKKELYRKYSNKIILIEIENEIFSHKKYSDIEKSLYNIFNKYLSLKYKTVDYKLLIPSNNYTDEELFEEAMKYSNDSLRLPPTKDLDSRIYGEILKRYNTYLDFAKVFGVELQITKEQWTKELVFDYFSQTIEKYNAINKNTIEKINPNIRSSMRKFGDILNLKLEFFNEYYTENTLSKEELEWLRNIYNNIYSNNMKITENHKNIAYNLYHKFDNRKVIDISSCLCCGKTLCNIDPIIVLCDDCFKKDIKSFKYARMEKEYEDNFYNIVKENKHLTVLGFNEVSQINYQSYQNFYRISWYEIIEKYGKINDLYKYILQEYKECCKINLNTSIEKFYTEHKYINKSLIQYFGIEKILTECGFRYKKTYTSDDLKNNFIDIKDKLGRTPFYEEFLKNTNISKIVYKRVLKSGKYDEIVKAYSTDEEYNKYLKENKSRKSEKAKTQLIGNYKHSNEDLEYNFKNIFNSFYKEYNRHPVKSEFINLSTIDESTYRKRLNMNWVKIKEYYGFQ